MWGTWIVGAAEARIGPIRVLLPVRAGRAGAASGSGSRPAGTGVLVTWSTWITSWLTDGVIRSSTGFGNTPSSTMSTISGATMSRSLHDRSRVPASSPVGSPWKTCW